MALTSEEWAQADAELRRAMLEGAPKIPDIQCDRPLRIGVVGYSDINKIKERLKSVYWTGANLVTILMNIERLLQYKHGHCDQFEMVSGLTDMGVPGMAYHLSKKGSHNKEVYVKTVGFACSKAKDYPQFPVDEKHIIGDEWGDESSAFLAYIDALVRIGDGEQSIREAEEFKKLYPDKPIIEVPDSGVLILGDQP